MRKLLLTLVLLFTLTTSGVSQILDMIKLGSSVLGGIMGGGNPLESALGGMFGGSQGGKLDAFILAELKELNSKNDAQLSNIIDDLKQSYEMVREAKQSTSLLDALSRMTSESRGILQTGGFLASEETFKSAYTIENMYMSLTTDAIQATNRVASAHRRLRSSSGDGNYVSGALTISSEIANLVSKSRRSYLLAVKTGDNVEFTQAERIAYLELASEDYNKATSKIRTLEAEAEMLAALAEQRDKEEKRNSKKSSKLGEDPSIPTIKTENN